MAADDLDGARNELLSFVADMHQWEVSAHKASMDFDSGPLESRTDEAHERLKDQMRSDLQSVFDAHRIAGTRNIGRLDGIVTSDPPEYNLRTMSIVKEEPVAGGVLIFSKKSDGLQSEYRFTIKKKEGRWTLVKKELLLLDGWHPADF